MAESLVTDIRRWLHSRHVLATTEWLQACLEFLREEHELASWTSWDPARWRQEVYQQWLHADLQELESGGLPEEVCVQPKAVLRMSTTVQLLFALDVSQPLYSQLRKEEGSTNENALVGAEPEETFGADAASSQRPTSGPGPNRTLLLHLTDGLRTVRGLEHRRCPALTLEALRPGVKLELRGPITARRGLLLLGPDSVRVLGGQVDSLVDEQTPADVLRAALRQATGREVPPPAGTRRVDASGDSGDRPRSEVAPQARAAAHEATDNLFDVDFDEWDAVEAPVRPRDERTASVAPQSAPEEDWEAQMAELDDWERDVAPAVKSEAVSQSARLRRAEWGEEMPPSSFREPNREAPKRDVQPSSFREPNREGPKRDVQPSSFREPEREGPKRDVQPSSYREPNREAPKEDVQPSCFREPKREGPKRERSPSPDPWPPRKRERAELMQELFGSPAPAPQLDSDDELLLGAAAAAEEAAVVSEAPFTYVLDIHGAVHDPSFEGRRCFTVKAFLLTLLSRLEHNEGTAWSLQARLGDGSANVDCEVSDALLASPLLVGRSAKDCARLREAARGGSESAKLELLECLGAVQARLARLNGLFELEVDPDSERPRVVGYREVDADTVTALRARVALLRAG